jgi:hypothetical protein
MVFKNDTVGKRCAVVLSSRSFFEDVEIVLDSTQRTLKLFLAKARAATSPECPPPIIHTA